MKNQILNFLKTKLTGVQNSYLDGVAETFAKTITEESRIETVLNESVLNTLKFSANFSQTEADRRVSDAQKAFEEKYAQNQNPAGDNNPTPKPIDTTSAQNPEMKAILEQMQLMQKQNEALQNGFNQLSGVNKVKSLEEKRAEMFNTYEVPEHLQSVFSVNESTDLTTLENQIKQVAESNKAFIQSQLQNSKQTSFSNPKPVNPTDTAKYSDMINTIDSILPKTK